MPKINSTFTSRVRNPGGDTLAAYLARRFTYRTAAEWNGLLAEGRLELEGATARGDESLRENMVLRFAVVDYDEPEVPLDFRILERTPDLCFVHKPAGLPVHRTGRIFFQTLANLVREKLGDTDWAPLNRLDRETSGLTAFARGAGAIRNWSPASPGSRWLKLYAAVTRGIPPEAGRIEVPLGELVGSPIRSRMHVHPDGKPALTLFRTIAARNGLALVALAPITGRKHQLRAHLAHIGCPIVGDKMYSLGGKAYLAQLDRELGAEDYQELGARRHLLHAFCLKIGYGSGPGGQGPGGQGPGGQRTDAEAWDWDVGPEFASMFPAVEARAWCATPAFRELWDEAESTRRG